MRAAHQAFHDALHHQTDHLQGGLRPQDPFHQRTHPDKRWVPRLAGQEKVQDRDQDLGGKMTVQRVQDEHIKGRLRALGVPRLGRGLEGVLRVVAQCVSDPLHHQSALLVILFLILGHGVVFRSSSLL